VSGLLSLQSRLRRRVAKQSTADDGSKDSGVDKRKRQWLELQARSHKCTVFAFATQVEIKTAVRIVLFFLFFHCVRLRVRARRLRRCRL
jgi:hypothetical protein